MKSINLNRNLQVWRYSPSFSRLLLLANKENKHATRIAYVFQGVKHMDIPSYFHCDAISWNVEKEGEIKFNLRSGKEKYIVEALRLDHEEDELEYHSPIPLFETFGLPH